QSSATGVPASCSFNMPMICSSLKRLRFIPWSSQWARAYFKMDYFNGQGHLQTLSAAAFKSSVVVMLALLATGPMEWVGFCIDMSLPYQAH
ncbi:hypothetical protein NAG74_33740, partial [Sinorhizobium meliloti]